MNEMKKQAKYVPKTALHSTKQNTTIETFTTKNRDIIDNPQSNIFKDIA